MKSDSTMPPPRKPVRSVVRAVSVIQSIGAGVKGPSAIAAQLGISKGTVFDLLKTLESVGFVRQDATSDAYVLGPALMRLAASGSSKLDLADITAPHLQKLSDQAGEVTHLGQRDGLSAVYLYRAKSQHTARMLDLNSLVGAHSPLHCTSMGKIFLAHLTDDEFAEYLLQDKKQYTGRTICDADALQAERLKVRDQGYGLNIGEFEEGVSSVAVPLELTDGPVTLGINIAMPSFRMPQKSIPQLVTKLIQTATDIRKDFGLE